MVILGVQEITTLIGTLGFPIAAYVGIFWYMSKRDEKYDNKLDKMSEVIDNNTKAITILTERIDNKNE